MRIIQRNQTSSFLFSDHCGVTDATAAISKWPNSMLHPRVSRKFQT